MFLDETYNGNGKLFSNGEVVYEGLFEKGIPNKIQLMEQCQEVTAEDIARRPEYFKGRMIIIHGKVSQVVDHDEARVDYLVGTGPKYNETFYVGYERPKGDVRILNNDIITVWGLCRGLYTYQNQFYSNVTKPGIWGYYIEIEQES